MKIKKRYLLLTPAFFLVGMLPASAISWQQLVPFLNQVQNIRSQFESIYENFDQKIAEWVGLENIGDIDVTIGEMGLPDVRELEKALKDLLRGGSEISEQEVRGQTVREMLRIKSDGTLSQEGQAQQKSKMDELSSNATETLAQGAMAQTRVVTQDVLKDIAMQNAQMSSTMSLMGSEIMDMSQKQDLANLSLSNISEGIDTQNLIHQNERLGSTYSILQMTGLVSGGFHKSGESE